jgi:hypothetical protein
MVSSRLCIKMVSSRVVLDTGVSFANVSLTTLNDPPRPCPITIAGALVDFYSLISSQIRPYLLVNDNNPPSR